MDVKIVRVLKSTHTEGILYIGTAVICRTLELPWDGNNSPTESCIPKGVWSAKLIKRSNDDVYYIEDKHPRSGIMIAVGNTIYDTTGNILVGMALVPSSDEGQPPTLRNSHAALKHLIEKTGGKNITLTIEERDSGSISARNASLNDNPGGISTQYRIAENGETIIVVGTEQYSTSHGGKLMFPAQAVREIRENYTTHKYVNIVIFKDAYTPMQLSIIKRDAKEWNKTVYFKQINSTIELIDYINNGDNTINRQMQKIGTIKIFAHGKPNSIEFGLKGRNEDKQRFTKEDVEKLSKESFTDVPIIYSYACRTGNSDTSEFYNDKNWMTLVRPKDSLAQKFSEHLNATVYAYLRRTNYQPTWDERGDIRYQNGYLTIKKDRLINIGKLIVNHKNWDEALWNINGAYKLPKAGNSPRGELPASIYIFRKGKEPSPV